MPYRNILVSFLFIPSVLLLAPPSQDTPTSPWIMHLAIASPSTALTRAFNRSLANITRSLVDAAGVVLTPLIITLPEESQGFSTKILRYTCDLLEEQHVVAVLVIGGSPAAFGVALAAGTAGIPVLWARGGAGESTGYFHQELGPLEVRLEPRARELLGAVRALLLATHWHQFTVLADTSAASGALLRQDFASIFNTPPLSPTILLLRADAAPHAIFRHLADISRSTRGVVLLLCNLDAAKRVTTEAKRLNMMSGHFVWLWVDTSPVNTVSDITSSKNVTTEQDGGTSAQQGILLDSSNPAMSESKQKARDKIRRRNRSLQKFNSTLEKLSNSSLQQVDKSKRSVASMSARIPLPQQAHSSKRKNTINIRDGVMRKPYREYNPRSSHGANVDYSTILQERIGDMHFQDIKLSFDNGLPRGSRRYYSEYRLSLQEWDEMADELPVGLLAIRPQPMRLERHLVKGAVRLIAETLRRVLTQCVDLLSLPHHGDYATSCWKNATDLQKNFSTIFARELKTATGDALAGNRVTDKSLMATFDILNLVPEKSEDYDMNVENNSDSKGAENQMVEQEELSWRVVGVVAGRSVHLDTIVWPGGEIVVAGLSSRARNVFRIVTALAPPFVMEGELDEDGQCLRGVPCHRVLTSDKDNLTLVFNEMEVQERMDEEAADEDITETSDKLNNEQRENIVDSSSKIPQSSTFELPNQPPRYKYKTSCCYGLAMDLLENVAEELDFDFHLYIVSDGMFGAKVRYRNVSKWNGIVGDLVSGAAHMSFAALSVSSVRSEVIDFSVPYFYSGVSFLAAPQQKNDVPLLAFLLPFSPELWIAIFTSLNVTAIAVAIYEWLSPFGLNPWGRQRSKNFSIASALWVMWGLLCGHLVAFKAPKSWPNKFLINVWGGFSVIFVASYTANIAALIAGLFFHNSVSNYHDRSLLSQRVGAPRASAADYYVHRANQLLWEHMQRHGVRDVEEGIEHLKNGTLDILIADTPILDYYRATDHGCKLQKIGDAINEDTYGIGMAKGFPLKDSISAVISKYSSNGYMDILQEKWYGALPCFKLATDMAQPRPLGVAAVAGVFILLGLGMVMGCLILIVEHLFYKYTLPILRHQPKGTIWRSRNIMFFSQKLYRFINCVELVSPHHAARELVHTLRQGQITSLFQKSVKRKEHEQRRRRRSKAQFFEMIQEIRRAQQEDRDQPPSLPEEPEDESDSSSPNKKTSPMPQKQHLLSPSIFTTRTSPRSIGRSFFSPKSRSPSNERRRFSTDMILSPLRGRFDGPSSVVGRRLSRGNSLCNSPPDLSSRRSSHFLEAKSTSNCNVAAKPDRMHLLDVSSVHEMAIGARLSSGGSPPLGSLSSCDLSAKRKRLLRSRSKSPIPSLLNVSGEGKTLKPSPRFRERVKSDTNPQDLINTRPRLRTPSPPENKKFHTISRCELNTASGRSKSLEIHKAASEDDNIERYKLKRQDFVTQDSVIEVNVTCCDNPTESSDDQQEIVKEKVREKPKRSPSTSPYPSLKKSHLMKRRQSHQQRLETTASPQQTSPTSPTNCREFLVPIQRHENPSSSRSPVRRRHKSQPVRSKSDTVSPSSSSAQDISNQHSPRTPLEDCDEVFDEIPPPPPPPFCHSKNSPNEGNSPLERLSKEELVDLWRSSETELRSTLLRAIRTKDVTDPP